MAKFWGDPEEIQGDRSVWGRRFECVRSSVLDLSNLRCLLDNPVQKVLKCPSFSFRLPLLLG